MNTQRVEELIRELLAEIGEDPDREGLLKTPERVRSIRIAFPGEVRSSEECRKALVAMVKRARSEAA